MQQSVHLNQVQEIKELFASVSDPQEKYRIIIDLGRKLPKMPQNFQTTENQVNGCQSILYLYTYQENSRLKFFVESDALISKGLAALLVMAYENCNLEEFLKSPPTFIKELDILSSISINRSNGFASVYKKIRNDTLKIFYANSMK